MLSYSFDLQAEAEAVERAVTQVLADGLRTADLVSPGGKAVSTREFANAVAEAIA
jgi:3-isopropylmalate dehydrogenase